VSLNTPAQRSYTPTMPVPSLYELARQRLIKNIDMLNDVGDIPFSFLEPVIRHIQNPIQLQELEENCPQILGETGDIWLRMIKRDIPDWDKKPHQPRDPRHWSKVYRKLKKDAEMEKLSQENALKEQMKALQQDRAQNKTLIVDSKVGYGARSSKMFSFGGRSWGAPGAPAKTGKAAFDKLKRGMFDRNRERPRVTQMPSHLLSMRRNTVRQVPERLVRMAENEGSKTMVLSKAASASVSSRPAPREREPEGSRPHITHRPVPQPQQSVAPPRTTLPPGQQFHAPKLRPTPQAAGAAAAQKRRREEPNMFHQQKRKKV
jgi:elongin-A